MLCIMDRALCDDTEQWLTPLPCWANSFVESSTHCMAGVGRRGAVKVAPTSGVAPGTESKNIQANNREIISPLSLKHQSRLDRY